MKISVVIPAYNSAHILGATIESAKRQTLAPHEIIVIDDGSRDETASVAERHGVRVIRQVNQGVCAARNTGVSAATGDWIALLDHDDLWQPQKLARQAAFVRDDAQFVTTDFVRTSGGIVEPQSVLDDPNYSLDVLTKVELEPNVIVCPNAGEEILKTGFFLFPSSVLIRRDLLVEVGMFRTDLRLCEDLECFLRVLTRTALVIVREPLWVWQEHGANHSYDVMGISEGWIRMGQLVHESPERYPAGTEATLVPMLRAVRRQLLTTYTSTGDFDSARRVARSVRKKDRSVTDAVLSAIVALPPPVWYAMRTASRALRSLGSGTRS